MTETIFAPATARGRAGVAVIRLSGPRARIALEALTGRCPSPRRAVHARLHHPTSGELLDDGLVLWFPGPASFTGEDVVEIQGHGGLAVRDALLGALGSLPGLRPAEAGEFSRRAFLNGKIDLTAAEGIADLVNAETEAQRRQALRQADGALARLYDGWRDQGIKLLAHLEAVIDFPDEDLPPSVEAALDHGIDALLAAITAHLAEGRKGERLRDGVQVAVIGAPNAGKSSLVNRLARREAAIVSAVAGTTRDVVEVHLDLGGYPLVVADTAGLRETEDLVEAEGVRRAKARAASADLTLLLFDGTTWDDATVDRALAEIAEGESDSLIVVTKTDLPEGGGWPDAYASRPVLAVSSATGAGLSGLEAVLAARAAALLDTSDVVFTRERHQAALREAQAGLARARTALLAELRAEDLRLALRALGRITGRVDVDDLLDVIFRDFCIGK